MKHEFRFSSRLAIGYALLTTALLPATAFAQSADDETGIVVEGYLLQNRTAIDAKRNEDRIADFLTSDEAGRQPDFNIADSLRRLPGVVTVFDEDEGVGVGLRGLPSDYSFISIDGGLIASTDRASRSINLETIPPTAVSRMEVIKSVTPDLDGQSVGGVVNLITRSAFDADGFYLTGSAQLGMSSNVGDLPDSFSNPSYRLDAAVSNIFGNEDQFGIFLSGNWFVKNRDQARPLPGHQVNEIGPIHHSHSLRDYSNKIERWSILGKVEFKPSPDLYMGLTGSFFDYQYSEAVYQFDVAGNSLVDQTASTGRFEQGRGTAQSIRYPLGQQLRTVNGKIDWRTSDRGRFEAMGSYSHATLPHPYKTANFSSDILPGFGYHYDYFPQNLSDSRSVSFDLNDPSVLENYDLYRFNYYHDGYFETNEKIFEVKADYSWNTEGYDSGLGFKVGAKHRNLKKDRWDRSTRYVLADASDVLTVGDFIDRSSVPDSYKYTGYIYPSIHPDLFDAYFAANPGRFVGSDASNPNDYYRVKEDVTAAYGMLTYSTGRHKLIAGLRYERTDVATSAALNGGEGTVEREFDYDNFLPSAVYTFRIDDRLRLRAGYAQAVGRPDYPVMAGAETRDETNLVLTRANPNIKPRESDSFDLGLDWFIAPGQFFSVAVFHKAIKNQISTVRTEEVIDGLVWTVNQPVNLDKVKISGIELSYSDDRFEFLPAPFDGLGISANLTILDGQKGPAPGGNIISQPDYLFNIAALYTQGPLSAKLTYNYIHDRPTSATAYEYRYEQLDAQLRIRLTEQVQFQLEGRNILNNPRRFYNIDPVRVTQINDFGNSWWFGVNFRY